MLILNKLMQRIIVTFPHPHLFYEEVHQVKFEARVKKLSIRNNIWLKLSITTGEWTPWITPTEIFNHYYYFIIKI